MLEPRQSDEHQLNCTLDNRCVKEFVILLYSQAVGSCEPLSPRIAEDIPDSGSVYDTVVMREDIYFPDRRSRIHTLKGCTAAKIVCHRFPVEGIHYLLGGPSQEASKIQRLVVCDSANTAPGWARGLPLSFMMERIRKGALRVFIAC